MGLVEYLVNFFTADNLSKVNTSSLHLTVQSRSMYVQLEFATYYYHPDY